MFPILLLVIILFFIYFYFSRLSHVDWLGQLSEEVWMWMSVHFKNRTFTCFSPGSVDADRFLGTRSTSIVQGNLHSWSPSSRLCCVPCMRFKFSAAVEIPPYVRITICGYSHARFVDLWYVINVSLTIYLFTLLMLLITSNGYRWFIASPQHPIALRHKNPIRRKNTTIGRGEKYEKCSSKKNTPISLCKWLWLFSDGNKHKLLVVSGDGKLHYFMFNLKFCSIYFPSRNQTNMLNRDLKGEQSKTCIIICPCKPQ